MIIVTHSTASIRGMLRLIAATVVLCLPAVGAFAQDSYDQPWRPQYHFTPSHNFMNDPERHGLL